MTIEEAIKQINESREWILKNLQVSDAIIVLLRVAEAWVKLKNDVDCRQIRLRVTSVNPERYRDAEAWIRPEDVLDSVATKMDELVNPSPKSDIQRVREWAQNPNQLVNRSYLELLLDQLEKEKDRDAG